MISASRNYGVRSSYGQSGQPNQEHTMDCTTNQDHCENCGSVNSEDIATGDGYTSCCNELVTSRRDCRDHHGQSSRAQAMIDAYVARAGYASRNAMIEGEGLATFRRMTDAAFSLNS